jgi:hypothetical protein
MPKIMIHEHIIIVSYKYIVTRVDRNMISIFRRYLFISDAMTYIFSAPDHHLLHFF